MKTIKHQKIGKKKSGIDTNELREFGILCGIEAVVWIMVWLFS